MFRWFSLSCAGVAVPSAVERKELQQFPAVKEVLLIVSSWVGHIGKAGNGNEMETGNWKLETGNWKLEPENRTENATS